MARKFSFTARTSALVIAAVIELLFGFGGDNAQAQGEARRVWDGEAGDGRWETCTNWSGDVCPDAATHVVFPRETAESVEAAASVRLTSLSLESGYQGRVTFKGSVEVAGDVVIEEGEVSWADIEVVRVGGSLRLSNGLLVLPSRTLRVGGTWEHAGGDLVIPDQSLEIILEGTGAAQMSDATVLPHLTIAANGERTLAGQVLCVAGTLRVQEGTAVASAAVAADRIVVDPAATWRGSTRINVRDLVLDTSRWELTEGQISLMDSPLEPYTSGGHCRPAATVLPARSFLSLLPAAVSEAVEVIVDQADTATSAALAIAAAIAAAGTLATLLAVSPQVLAEAFPRIVPLFPFFRRRRRPFGRVIDAESGAPIPGVSVLVLDPELQQTKDRATTGTDGSFALLLTPGNYLFLAKKDGYEQVNQASPSFLFPDEQFVTQAPVQVREEGTVPFVVALRRLVRASAWEQRRLRWQRAWVASQIVLSRLSRPLLLVGSLITIVALVRTRSLLPGVLAVVYILFLTLDLVVARSFRRTVGRVRSEGSNEAVGLASIRLVDRLNNRIVQTRVTTPGGHYLLLAPRGQFTMQVVHPAHVPFTKPVSVRAAGGRAITVDPTLSRRGKTGQ